MNLEPTLLLKLIFSGVGLPYDVPHRAEAPKQALQEAPRSWTSSVEVQLDVIGVVGLAWSPLLVVVQGTVPVPPVLLHPIAAASVIAGGGRPRVLVVLLLQLENAVLKVPTLAARRVHAQGNVLGARPAQHRLLVLARRLQGDGQVCGRGQVGDDLRGQVGRGNGRRLGVGVGRVGFLHRVPDHRELELLLQLAH